MWMTRRLVCVLAFVAGAMLLTLNRQTLADQGCMEWNEELGQMVPCGCPNTDISEATKSCASDKITCGDDNGFPGNCDNVDRHYTVETWPKECLSNQPNRKCSDVDTPCVKRTGCKYDDVTKKCTPFNDGEVVSKAIKHEGADCKK